MVRSRLAKAGLTSNVLILLVAAFLMAFGNGALITNVLKNDADVPKVRKKRNDRFRHDNVFHTVLGPLEIESSAYRPELDILRDARIPEKEKLAGH